MAAGMLALLLLSLLSAAALAVTTTAPEGSSAAAALPEESGDTMVRVGLDGSYEMRIPLEGYLSRLKNTKKPQILAYVADDVYYFALDAVTMPGSIPAVRFLLSDDKSTVYFSATVIATQEALAGQETLLLTLQSAGEPMRWDLRFTLPGQSAPLAALRVNLDLTGRHKVGQLGRDLGVTVRALHEPAPAVPSATAPATSETGTAATPGQNTEGGKTRRPGSYVLMLLLTLLILGMLVVWHFCKNQPWLRKPADLLSGWVRSLTKKLPVIHLPSLLDQLKRKTRRPKDVVPATPPEGTSPTDDEPPISRRPSPPQPEAPSIAPSPPPAQDEEDPLPLTNFFRRREGSRPANSAAHVTSLAGLEITDEDDISSLTGTVVMAHAPTRSAAMQESEEDEMNAFFQGKRPLESLRVQLVPVELLNRELLYRDRQAPTREVRPLFEEHPNGQTYAISPQSGRLYLHPENFAPPLCMVQSSLRGEFLETCFQLEDALGRRVPLEQAIRRRILGVSPARTVRTPQGIEIREKGRLIIGSI
jgi:hypothetical protein